MLGADEQRDLALDDVEGLLVVVVDVQRRQRLAKLGYLSARTEPGRTRPRTHYELTDKGAEALRAWLAEPAAMPRVQHEGIVKLLAADFSDDATRRRPWPAWAPSSTRPKRSSTRSWSAFPTCPTHATYG